VATGETGKARCAAHDDGDVEFYGAVRCRNYQLSTLYRSIQSGIIRVGNLPAKAEDCGDPCHVFGILNGNTLH